MISKTVHLISKKKKNNNNNNNNFGVMIMITFNDKLFTTKLQFFLKKFHFLKTNTIFFLLPL